MLEQQLKKLNFYKSVKFETKGKQLFARSSDRTTLQEKTEEYFKKNKILYKPTLNEVPQPHVDLAFGLLNLNILSKSS